MFKLTQSRHRYVALLGAAAAATLAVATLNVGSASAATLLSDSFDSSSSTWSKSGGTWAVTGGEYQQSNVSSELARAFAGDTAWADYSLQARVRPTAFSGSDSFVGLGARTSGSTTFYRLALLNTGRAELQAVNSGAVTVIGGVSRTVSTGTWYTLRVDVTGSTITGFLDGTRIASGTNPTVPAGRISLQTFHATAAFDDVTVASSGSDPTPTPTATGTGTPVPTTPVPTTTTPGGGTSSSVVHGYATVGGSTTGGGSAAATTVTSLSALTTAAAGSSAAVIKVNGNFTCTEDVRVASNKTIVGVGSGSGLTGCGLNLKTVSNVIVRNLRIAKVLADNGNGDAIHIESDAHHIWIDHNDLSSDQTHDKDYYDGLIDISHAADYITVSWNYLHDHFKGSLVGHSDNNSSEDTGTFHVTYDHNYFSNINSRGPSLRFGTGHAYNNYYANMSTAVHSRMGAQFLVQNNVFRSVTTPIQTNVDSDVDGYVNESGNDFGGGTNKISQTGSFTSPPYSYTLDSTSSVISNVPTGVGTGKVG